MKRVLCMLLCVLLLLGTAFAEADLEGFEAPELTPEELAQWALWAEEGADDEEEAAAEEDATAANAADLTPEEEAQLAELALLIDDEEAGTAVDLSNLERNEDLPDNVVNVLLLGLDNRTVQMETGRSDATIICSIHTDTGAVTLTSIARDTAVVVPGYKNRKRMNSAFKFGSKDGDLAKGAELAMKTVNRNFQMNISKYVVVNIHGLADIIEALGGIDMEMTRAEASAINYELFDKEPMDSNAGRKRLKLETGVQHLDGMQAVTYGRIRNLKGQNDINRNGRQRALLEKLLEKVMADMDLMKLMTLIQTALPYAKTNLTLDEMVNLGMAVLGGEAMQNLQNGGAVLQQFGIPMEKQYGYRKFESETLVYISDKRLMTTLEAMQQLVYGESYVKESK